MSGSGKDNSIDHLAMVYARQIILACLFSFAVAASGQIAEAMKLPECLHKFGKDSMKVRVNMGYLQKYYHEHKYNEAYGCWTYLFKHAPCTYKSIYQLGTPIIAKLADENKDRPGRNGLVDTLMMIFPTRIKYFGEEGLVKGSWGYNMARYQPEKTGEILSLFARYVELRGDSLNEQYVRTYMWHGIKAMRKGLFDTQQVYKLYWQLSGLAVKQLNQSREINDSIAVQDWTNAISNLDYMMGQLVDCKGVQKLFAPILAKRTDSLETLGRMFNLYSSKSCYDEGYMAVVERINAMSPVAGLAAILGEYSEELGHPQEAESYYLQAVDLSNDSDVRFTLFYSLSMLTLNSHPERAINYAKRAVFINPKNAEALIVLGRSVYKAACGSDLDKAIAACAAADLFDIAKSTDLNRGEEAEKQTLIHKAYFPTALQLEEAGLKTGDAYTIPCSGIKTTIRLR